MWSRTSTLKTSNKNWWNHVSNWAFDKLFFFIENHHSFALCKYFYDFVFLDSLGGHGKGDSRHQPMRPAQEMRPTLRSSLPDMSKPAKTYDLLVLQTTNKELPEDVDRFENLRHYSNSKSFHEKITTISALKKYVLMKMIWQQELLFPHYFLIEPSNCCNVS